MNAVARKNAVTQYRKVDVRANVETASPHRLIEMLLDGALEKIHFARGCMERREIGPKCEAIDWSLAILDGLSSSLDRERGGEIASNLSGLYEYMMARLVQANAQNDLDTLDEVTRLLGEIRQGWQGIRPN